MPGSSMRILPKATYTFNPATTGTPQHTIVFAKGINVANARDLTLLVRLHNPTTMPGASQLIVQLLIEAPTEEDPATDFIYTTTPLGTVTIGAVPTVPALYLINPTDTAPFGATVRVVGLVTVPIGGTALTLTTSIDLVAKG